MSWKKSGQCNTQEIRLLIQQVLESLQSPSCSLEEKMKLLDRIHCFRLDVEDGEFLISNRELANDLVDQEIPTILIEEWKRNTSNKLYANQILRSLMNLSYGMTILLIFVQPPTMNCSTVSTG